MTPDELTLWKKIESFPLDKADSEFSFSDRVARENGWTIGYTNRVIIEYKRFIYLCCVSDKGVTPSDPVDQVWHLHLTYTKSYWVDFCKETLEKEIHHNPTKGGTNEASKFDVYYTHLKNLYNIHFSSNPPVDIWPSNQVRFSDIDFQRVNRKRFWLIKKPTRKLMSYVSVFLIVIIGLLSIQAVFIPVVTILFFVVIISVAVYAIRNKGKGDGSGGTSSCGAGGCSSGSGHSGDSGCSSSGCSGCGGGGGGD